MALFTLTDIKFGKSDSNRKGKASSQLVGGGYESNILRYPEDIGNYDRGHYMVIHINQQINTQFPSQTTGDDPTVIANRRKYGYDTPLTNAGVAFETIGKTSVVQGAKDLYGSAINSTSGVLKDFAGAAEEGLKAGWKAASSIAGARTIKRTTDTIALYMPDTLNFQHNQTYNSVSLTGLPAAVLAAGVSTADTLKRNPGADATKALVQNLSPYLANYAANKLGDIGKFAFAAGFGMVTNPQLELLYTSPEFRTFRFDFMFYPRSEKEAREVQSILSRLKFHQAPEVRKESKGFFLIPPSEFDIEFYYNGGINPNIPEISTCVLQSIEVNYAPNGGFATYEVPGEINASLGRTGMPVAIQLSLQFMETEYLTKSHLDTRNLSGTGVDMLSSSYMGSVDSSGDGTGGE
jgi:hypothetical protein